MVTLKQIAVECGVSIATVSKALNHAPDIGEATAEKVRAKALELGYHPNLAARTLKTNRSYSIGVLFEDVTGSGLAHEYFGDLLNALKDETENSGYTVTFLSRNLGGRRTTYLENCQYRSCDGVIIVSADFNNPEVTELTNSSIPVVTIDYIYNSCSAVVSDNIQGMYDLVRYIYDLGHRRVAFIHGEDTSVTRSRMAAFYQFCSEKDLKIPGEWVLPSRYHDARLSGLATRGLLEKDVWPTCILYPDDISLQGGITELEKHGLSVPQDISVAGYDGIRMSRILRPVITSLHQDSKTLGTRAAQLLIGRIENPRTFIPKVETVAGTLQKGGTVRRI